MLTWWRSPRCVELIIPIAAARLITEARLSAPGAAATAMQSDCRGREVSLRRLPPPDWWLPGLTEPADIYRLYEYLRGAAPFADCRPTIRPRPSRGFVQLGLVNSARLPTSISNWRISFDDR